MRLLLCVCGVCDNYHIFVFDKDMHVSFIDDAISVLKTKWCYFNYIMCMCRHAINKLSNVIDCVFI